jgi:hypothetical protein
MSEFIRALVTQGWLWAAFLILMLLFALGKKCPWHLEFQLEIICATSLAVGLFIIGMLVFAMMTSPSSATMATIDTTVLMP